MGWNIAAACRQAGVSRDWAYQTENGYKKDGSSLIDEKEQANLPGPIPVTRLCDQALRGLEDFEFFRRYYLGHVSTPWQIDVANDLVYLQATDDKEYSVINCPPGVGKTTLIHDIACWMTCRDRRLRGLMGSRTETNARRMLGRIKRTLERPTPYHAPSEDIEKGIACDAEASLAMHYGVFKPPRAASDIWRMDEFVVAQLDNIPIEEKEPTWSSYGLDSGVLSNRFGVIFWDDLIDKKTNRTVETREAIVEKWDEEFETRLEPGGMLTVIGQRLHMEDLYATLRDRTIAIDPDDEHSDTRKMYHHIVFPAHDDTKCQGIHKPDKAKPQPEGCLLDPYRLSWVECRKLMSKRHIWPIVYQQTDGDPDDGFVHPIWISGGEKDGVEYPGCWDSARGLAELPPLDGKTYSIATVDPSPTKYWAIEWWVYHESSEYRFLMDLEKRAMDANEFFDYNPITKQYSGLLCDWQERSEALGHPISHWIVERNAAQRFMLQQTTLQQYRAKHRFRVIPHETTMNKSHPEFGVQSVASKFEHGLVRLPGKQGSPGRMAALKLVEEALRYGKQSVDDCIMAYWFFEWNLPKIRVPDRSREPRLKVPSWLKELAS